MAGESSEAGQMDVLLEQQAEAGTPRPCASGGNGFTGHQQHPLAGETPCLGYRLPDPPGLVMPQNSPLPDDTSSPMLDLIQADPSSLPVLHPFWDATLAEGGGSLLPHQHTSVGSQQQHMHLVAIAQHLAAEGGLLLSSEGGGEQFSLEHCTAAELGGALGFLEMQELFAIASLPTAPCASLPTGSCASEGQALPPAAETREAEDREPQQLRHTVMDHGGAQLLGHAGIDLGSQQHAGMDPRVSQRQHPERPCSSFEDVAALTGMGRLSAAGPGPCEVAGSSLWAGGEAIPLQCLSKEQLIGQVLHLQAQLREQVREGGRHAPQPWLRLGDFVHRYIAEGSRRLIPPPLLCSVQAALLQQRDQELQSLCLLLPPNTSSASEARPLITQVQPAVLDTAAL